MKAIKYILMAICMVSVLGVSAQTLTEQPQAQFQSTSTMQASGSVLASQPMLNADGTAYSPAASAPAGGPRKIGGLPGSGDLPDKSGTDNTPVGDAVLPLMLMALAFGGVIYLRRRKAVNR